MIEVPASILLSLEKQNHTHLQTYQTRHTKSNLLTLPCLSDSTYPLGPAKKIAKRQDAKPEETTATWLCFPYCHTILAYCAGIFGSNASKLCQTCAPPLISFSGADSLWVPGFGAAAPPLSVCGPLYEEGWSANSLTCVARRKAHIRNVAVRSSMTPTAEGEEKLWKQENSSLSVNPDISTSNQT